MAYVGHRWDPEEVFGWGASYNSSSMFCPVSLGAISQGAGLQGPFCSGRARSDACFLDPDNVPIAVCFMKDHIRKIALYALATQAELPRSFAGLARRGDSRLCRYIAAVWSRICQPGLTSEVTAEDLIAILERMIEGRCLAVGPLKEETLWWRHVESGLGFLPYARLCVNAPSIWVCAILLHTHDDLEAFGLEGSRGTFL